MSLSEDVDLEEFVMTKDDLSGADIKAVCTEAGLLALRERRMRVTKADFTTAREKVSSFVHEWGLILIRFFRCFTGRTRVHQKVFTFDLFLCFGCITLHNYTLIARSPQSRLILLTCGMAPMR